MTKLNLHRRHAREIGFETDFDLPDDQWVKLFGEYDRPLLFLDWYSIQRTRHTLYATLGRVGVGKYHLDIRYRTSGGRQRRPKAIRNLASDLSLLGQDVGVCELGVDSTFDYRKQEFRSTLRIPLKLASVPDSAFDEIKGLRVVKLDEDGSARYSVIVDDGNEQEFTQSVFFTYTGKLSQETLAAAFEAAVGISERFVVRSHSPRPGEQ